MPRLDDVARAGDRRLEMPCRPRCGDRPRRRPRSAATSCLSSLRNSRRPSGEQSSDRVGVLLPPGRVAHDRHPVQAGGRRRLRRGRPTRRSGWSFSPASRTSPATRTSRPCPAAGTRNPLPPGRRAEVVEAAVVAVGVVEQRLGRPRPAPTARCRRSRRPTGCRSAAQNAARRPSRALAGSSRARIPPFQRSPSGCRGRTARPGARRRVSSTM